MNSTLNEVRAAIEKRIAAELAMAPSYPVAYQNMPFSPPNNSPWLQAFIRFGDNNYATLLGPGAGFNRHNGVLTINVYTPIGAGSGANFTIAERMKALFDRLDLGGIHFDAASGPFQVTPAAPAAYYQTQLAITFSAYLD
jgi:hypothetical protein